MKKNMRRRLVWLVTSAFLLIPDLFATPAFAQVNGANAEEETAGASAPIDEVLVTGEQPGPGLWKITHGGTNVVWVLGTAGAVPKDVKWRSRQVEDVIAHANAVIFGESVSSTNIGFFRGLLLLRSVLKLRYNPDEAQLKDLIPPERYERWLVLRKKYFKDDADYDRVRPMFIAMQLAEAAARESGLGAEGSLGRIVATTAKKHDVPIRHAEVKMAIADPKKAIRDFSATPRDQDLACFNTTLDNLDSDLDKAKSRARAWAVGDIEAFRQLPAPVAQPVCLEAITSARDLQSEFTKMREGLNDAWLWEVQKALELNAVTLAVTSLDDVLSSTGRLARLRERGYTIEAP
jgi:uncharacterized protein YbaP (TraB family)